MLMRIRLVSVSALALATAVPTRPQSTPKTLTSSELVQMALKRNQDFVASQQQLPEAQGLLRQAGVRLAPTLEINVTNGNVVGSPGEQDYSAGYFLPFETGGKRSKRIQVARTGISLAEAEIAEQRRQLSFDVKDRFAQAFAVEEKLKILQQVLDVMQQSSRLTAARVQQGDAAALDQQLLAVEVNRVQAEQVSFNAKAETNLLQLRQFVGMKDDEPLQLSVQPPGAQQDDLHDLLQKATQVRPDLLAARMLEQQTMAEVNLAKAQGTPDVTASASYAHRNTQFDNQYGLTASGARTLLQDRDNVLSVGLSVPLFTKKHNQGNIEAAVSRQSAARLRREYLERTVPLEVAAAYKRFTAATQALDLYRSGVVQQSEKNLEVVRQAYALGQLRSLDVLAEQRRVLDTEMAYVDAETELAEAHAELSRAVGEELP